MRTLFIQNFLIAIACFVLSGCGGKAAPFETLRPAGDATGDAYEALGGGYGVWVSASTARARASSESEALAFADFLRSSGVRLVLLESRTLNDEVLFPSDTHEVLGGDAGLLARVIAANNTQGIETVAAIPVFLGVPGEGEAPMEAGLDAASGEVRVMERRPAGTGAALPYRSLFAESARLRARALLMEIARVEGLSSVCLLHVGLPGHATDFRDEARAAFEQSMGAAVSAWPDAILTVDAVTEDGGAETARMTPGPMWVPWAQWRTGIVSTLLFQFSVMLRQESLAVRGAALDVGLMANGYLDQRVRTGVNWVSVANAEEPGVAELFERLYLETFAPIVTRDQARTLGLQESASLEAVLATASRFTPETVERWVVISLVPYLNETGKLDTQGRRDLRAALRFARRQRVPVVVMDFDLLRRETAWDDVRAALTMP